MSIVDNITYDKEVITSHKEVLYYFETMRKCELRHKEITERSRNRILNLKSRGDDLGIKYKKISDLTKYCKNWSNDEIYALILRAVNNDQNYIKFKKFVYECIDTIHDIKKQKNDVKILNQKDKLKASQILKQKGIKVGVVTFAYKQMKEKAKFYIDNELEVSENGLSEYTYLDDFVNIYVHREICEFRQERQKPKTIPLEVLSSKGTDILTKDVIEFIVDETIRVNKRIHIEKEEQRKMIENEILQIFGMPPSHKDVGLYSESLRPEWKKHNTEHNHFVEVLNTLGHRYGFTLKLCEYDMLSSTYQYILASSSFNVFIETNLRKIIRLNVKTVKNAYEDIKIFDEKYKELNLFTHGILKRFIAFDE